MHEAADHDHESQYSWRVQCYAVTNYQESIEAQLEALDLGQLSGFTSSWRESTKIFFQA